MLSTSAWFDPGTCCASAFAAPQQSNDGACSSRAHSCLLSCCGKKCSQSVGLSPASPVTALSCCKPLAQSRARLAVHHEHDAEGAAQAAPDAERARVAAVKARRAGRVVHLERRVREQQRARAAQRERRLDQRGAAEQRDVDLAAPLGRRVRACAGGRGRRSARGSGPARAPPRRAARRAPPHRAARRAPLRLAGGSRCQHWT